MIETAVSSYLQAYSGLTALISTRMYAVTLPSSPTYPNVTYQKVSASDEMGMGQDNGISVCRMQFDCWGSSYPSAKAVANQIKNAFKNYSDASNGTTIHCAKLVNEIDTYEKIYHITVEIEFTYQE